MNATGRFHIAFYGDDFTGSTDALEVLAFAGLKTALFLKPPDGDSLTRFPDLDAFGVAGDSRDMSVAEMDEELPAIFEALARTGAGIIHYKTCSTFDSAPAIGSIGHVAELARDAYPTRFLPIVGATPALQRYCLFGNLFAQSGTDGQIYRIDRHPIMSVHPVTPMTEGDLALHLGRQTKLAVAKFPFVHLRDGVDSARSRLDEVAAAGAPLVLFDSASAEDLTVVGGLLAEESRRRAPLFVIGGSGVEYALVQWRQEEGGQTEAPPPEETPATDRILAISGSASRLTGSQIRTAIDAGFVEIALDARTLLDPERGRAAAARAVEEASRALEAGRSVLIHTASSPGDPRIGAFLAWASSEADPDAARAGARRNLGLRLGEIARDILERTGLRRIIVSGGDTSSQVVQVIAPDALEVAARLTPGAPLCRMRSRRPSLNGIEIALKGGQMGGQDFFVRALEGTGSPVRQGGT